MPGPRLALTVLVVSVLAAAASPAQDSTYPASVERWRADHERELRADDGWLTVVGLEWLKPGANRAGSGAGMDVRLPAGAAANLGVFRLEGARVRFEPAPGVRVAIGGKPASAQWLRPNADVLTTGSLALFIIERGGRFAVRIKDWDSEARRGFAGETWFPVRGPWRIVARFEPYDPPKMIPILNVLGQQQAQPSPGAAVFEVEGKEYRLEPIVEGTRLFFIFRDATSGATTYPAGRFLYADPPRDGHVVLDFNRAENPPCAFTAFATCPLPPRQNQLPVAIEAGEKYGAASNSSTHHVWRLM